MSVTPEVRHGGHSSTGQAFVMRILSMAGDGIPRKALRNHDRDAGGSRHRPPHATSGMFACIGLADEYLLRL
ncbi:protein of unknown function [Rhodovastum atsumiense]|nr:protein of unknown function [Rhodovastum atsumiense]